MGCRMAHKSLILGPAPRIRARAVGRYCQWRSTVDTPSHSQLQRAANEGSGYCAAAWLRSIQACTSSIQPAARIRSKPDQEWSAASGARCWCALVHSTKQHAGLPCSATEGDCHHTNRRAMQSCASWRKADRIRLTVLAKRRAYALAYYVAAFAKSDAHAQLISVRHNATPNRQTDSQHLNTVVRLA